MCCFSKPIAHVSATSILARATGQGRQVLAYEMRLAVAPSAGAGLGRRLLDLALRAAGGRPARPDVGLGAEASEVAMILPLPVPVGAADDALRFIDLSGYPNFFSDLRRGFPMEFQALTRGGPVPQPAAKAVLKVEKVGSFEASFVPTVADFARLDARFRLPSEVWDALPEYADFGFAVFKLADLGREARPVHPMAFEFPRRDPRALFFPTVHVHDGRVAAEADFDHTLYAQGDEALFARLGPTWTRSSGGARGFVDIARAAGLVDGDTPCWRRTIVGRWPNRDTLVAATD